MAATHVTTSEVHLPWCGAQCAAVVTGVHESRPVPVAGRGTELVGMTVGVERLIGSPSIDLVVLEIVQDDQAVQYRLPLGQVRAVRYALSGAFRRLASG